MKYCISKCIDIYVSAYYNKSIKIYNILLYKIRGGNNMVIAMAVLKFVGGIIPFVAELLKAVM
ncbi:hypothetical protein CON94_27770 [Bacillus pseudomycoides]|uniref:hypothetical protein n=1 Tax=Bacillus pseudomycoides TaxID=64104 RepID=UPI000BEDE0F8|nr:hypothetical protein [Bacillus pseudomycoides]PEF72188.1 hypothetical protein CON94_27770 [Bacillus pseudomycoides]PEL70649.1 hypothetical protein CN615_29955 [Bacillus pseudomycoides]